MIARTLENREVIFYFPSQSSYAVLLGVKEFKDFPSLESVLKECVLYSFGHVLRFREFVKNYPREKIGERLKGKFILIDTARVIYDRYVELSRENNLTLSEVIDLAVFFATWNWSEKKNGKAKR